MAFGLKQIGKAASDAARKAKKAAKVKADAAGMRKAKKLAQQGMATAAKKKPVKTAAPSKQWVPYEKKYGPLTSAQKKMQPAIKAIDKQYKQKFDNAMKKTTAESRKKALKQANDWRQNQHKKLKK